jgi:DNA-binding HxlR family transcriptional regulator
MMGKVLLARDAIELLSNKWRVAILQVLRDGPMRTNELQRAMREVSAKVLTQTLRGMERDGLIDHRTYDVMPPRVEYALTDMGASSIKPLQALSNWAKAHITERDFSRRKFDLATNAAALWTHDPLQSHKRQRDDGYPKVSKSPKGI